MTNEFNNSKSKTLSFISGILFFMPAIGSIYVALTDIGYLFDELSSYYPTFLNVLTSLIGLISGLALCAGFIILGIALIIRKPDSPLFRISSFIITAGYLAETVLQCFYIFMYGIDLYIVVSFISLLTWIAFTILLIKIAPVFVRKAKLTFILLPAVTAALYLLYCTTSYFDFLDIVWLIECAATILFGVAIYIVFLYEEQRASDSDESGYAECASDTAAYIPEKPVATPEGYTDIVKLILLSIFTLGIYVYIWIYRLSQYLSKRSPVALQHTPGVQVVLCFFVPFYIVYWIYRQCEAIEDIKQKASGSSSKDMPLVCLLLSVFGVGIIAYALMQDQINKLVTGTTAPAAQAHTQTQSESEPQTPSVSETGSEEPQMPPSSDQVCTETDMQIETIRKLKALLDAGILTEEEFEAKKKAVLGL